MGIYFFKHRTQPYLKVGFHGSSNPWNRITGGGFQGNICPEGLADEPHTAYELLAWFATLGFQEEARLHTAFAASRLCGEWWPAADYAKIYQATAAMGCPDTAYNFRGPMDVTVPTMRILVSYDLPLEKKDLILSLLPTEGALRQLGITETRFVTTTDSGLMRAIDAEQAQEEPEVQEAQGLTTDPKKRWKVWRSCDERRMATLFAAGSTIQEIAADLGRTPRAISMRLKKQIQAAIQADGVVKARQRYGDPRLRAIWDDLIRAGEA